MRHFTTVLPRSALRKQALLCAAGGLPAAFQENVSCRRIAVTTRFNALPRILAARLHGRTAQAIVSNHHAASRATRDVATITCASCKACCCRLEVMLMGDDDVPPELTAVDRWGGTVMARLQDGWCAALDRNTLLCGIYARRPSVCRDFPVGDHDCMTERAKASL